MASVWAERCGWAAELRDIWTQLITRRAQLNKSLNLYYRGLREMSCISILQWQRKLTSHFCNWKMRYLQINTLYRYRQYKVQGWMVLTVIRGLHIMTYYYVKRYICTNIYKCVSIFLFIFCIEMVSCIYIYIYIFNKWLKVIINIYIKLVKVLTVLTVSSHFITIY